MCSLVSPYLGLAEKVAKLPIVILGLFALLLSAFSLTSTSPTCLFPLKAQGSVSFSPEIPCSDLNMSPVSGCLSSDAAFSCSCKLTYLGISCAPGKNVNPSSSQGSQSLPCDTTSSGPSISALPACLSSKAFVSFCKLAHFELGPAHSGGINPAHSGDINPSHCGDINPSHCGDITLPIVV